MFSSSEPSGPTCMFMMSSLTKELSTCTRLMVLILVILFPVQYCVVVLISASGNLCIHHGTLALMNPEEKNPQKYHSGVKAGQKYIPKFFVL